GFPFAVEDGAALRGNGNDAYAVGFGALGEALTVYHLQIPQPRDQSAEYRDCEVIDDLQPKSSLPQVLIRVEGLISVRSHNVFITLVSNGALPGDVAFDLHLY